MFEQYLYGTTAINGPQGFRIIALTKLGGMHITPLMGMEDAERLGLVKKVGEPSPEDSQANAVEFTE